MTPSPWWHSPSRPCLMKPLRRWSDTTVFCSNNRWTKKKNKKLKHLVSFEYELTHLKRNKKVWVLISNQYYCIHFRRFVPFLSKKIRDGGKFEISIRLDKINSKRSGKFIFSFRKNQNPSKQRSPCAVMCVIIECGKCRLLLFSHILKSVKRNNLKENDEFDISHFRYCRLLTSKRWTFHKY